MQHNDQIYIKLQRHLDKQPVGFPATRSGVEIKILKHIFTPKEAEIACCLGYKLEPLKTIFDRAPCIWKYSFVPARNKPRAICSSFLSFLPTEVSAACGFPGL